MTTHKAKVLVEQWFYNQCGGSGEHIRLRLFSDHDGYLMFWIRFSDRIVKGNVNEEGLQEWLTEVEDYVSKSIPPGYVPPILITNFTRPPGDDGCTTLVSHLENIP